MSFQQPLYLIGLLAVGIPIAIHLFNLRKFKRVYFSHTDLLKSTLQQSQKQRQLKHLVLLFTRILFVITFVLALAQPSCHPTQGTTDKQIVVFVDNSPSMGVVDNHQTLLDKAVYDAKQLAKQLSADNRILFLTAHSKTVQWLSTSELVQALDQVSLAAQGQPPLTQIIEKASIATQQKKGSMPIDLYYFSDGQRVDTVGKNFEKPLVSLYYWQYGSASEANTYIDSVEQSLSDIQSALVVQANVKYNGEAQESSGSINIWQNGTASAVQPYHTDSSKLASVAFQLEPHALHWNDYALTLSDSALHYDDTFYFAVKADLSKTVEHVHQGIPNPFIQTVYNSWPDIRLQTSRQTTSFSQDADICIIEWPSLWNETFENALETQIEQGQTLVIIPNRQADPTQLSKAFEKLFNVQIESLDTATNKVGSVNTQSILLRSVFANIPKQVDWPQVQWHFRYAYTGTSYAEPVLSLANGDPLLLNIPVGNGRVQLFACDLQLQTTTLPTHYIFAPLFYNMLNAANSGQLVFGRIGEQLILPYKRSNNASQNIWQLHQEGESSIPLQQIKGNQLIIWLNPSNIKTGFAWLSNGVDSIRLGINMNAKESDRIFWTAETLKEAFDLGQIQLTAGGYSKDNFDTSNTFPLWKLCVILGLCALAFETFWLFKNRTLKQSN